MQLKHDENTLISGTNQQQGQNRPGRDDQSMPYGEQSRQHSSNTSTTGKVTVQPTNHILVLSKSKLSDTAIQFLKQSWRLQLKHYENTLISANNQQQAQDQHPSTHPITSKAAEERSEEQAVQGRNRSYPNEKQVRRDEAERVVRWQ